jgi:photosystem II stability/assembly factor-like uncharacterized protein
VRGIFALDTNTAVAVGASGLILRTIDGGDTWTVQPSSTTTNLYSVAFSDFKTGLAVGYGGTLLRTADGGVTWSAVPSGVTGSLCSVVLSAGGVGLIAGMTGADFCDGAFIARYGGITLRSTDAGKTWAPSQSTLHLLWSVSMIDPGFTLAAGDQSFIERSVDGGDTWTVLDIDNRAIGGVRAILFSTPSMRWPLPVSES